MTRLQLAQRRAFQIAPGNAVILNGAAGPFIAMKALREGKEYFHHYLVDLDPPRDGTAGMIYVDPEELLADCGRRPEIELGTADDAGPPGVGDVFCNAKGTFLKLHEDPKSQKMYAFVKVDGGTLLRRQERGITAVHRRWRLKGLAGGLTVAEALAG